MSTPTPRTDSEEYPDGEGQSFHVVSADFARTLETELAALTAERDQLKEKAKDDFEMFHGLRMKLTAACGDPYKLHDEALDDIISERDQLRAEVERLGHLEALLRSSAADMTAGSITAGGVADLRAENERLRRAYVRPDDIRAQLESAIARAEADLAALGQSFDDNCRGVVKIADDLTAATAERDQLRADRTYNHECINRLASETGTLGEKSEKVVDVVLSTIDQLRAENVTFRAAQKACEACDEPTAFEVRQLRARAELAEAELGKLRGFYNEIVAECGHDLIVREYRQRGELLRDEANRRKDAEAELATATEECKNVRLKWHAVMGMCAAKEDAIIESDEELARLRARAERAEAEVERLGHLEAVLRSCAFDKDGTAWKTVCGWWSKKYDAVERQMSENATRAERAEADAAAYLKRAESFRKIGDEAETELAKERTRTKQIATALTDAISTYFGADKLVTAERIEAWQAALKEDAT